MKKNDSKTVIVIGGAGLIGESLASAINDIGWNAIIADRQEAITNDKDLIVDITSKSSIELLISSAAKRYGKIDGVINSAFPRNNNYGRKFEEVTFEDFTENLTMHLGGYFLVMQRFALYFKEHSGGNIINLASIYGVIPPRFEIYKGTSMTSAVEYAAIKSALIHLTKYVAKYFKGSNVRINCISPGGVMDNQPQKFIDQYIEHTLSTSMLSPNDVAGVAIFLLSDDSMHINGQNIIVDDGFTL